MLALTKIRRICSSLDKARAIRSIKGWLARPFARIKNALKVVALLLLLEH